MPAVFPSGQNTFVKSHEASGKLVVNFSRNVKDFALNRYVQIINGKKPAGYYLDITVEEAGRILQTDGANFLWPDGHDAPPGTDGTESFQWKEFICTRYAPAFRLGEIAIDAADWNILAMHAALKAQQAMTLRTQLCITALTTTGNYAASHTSAVASISGNTGTWADSTTARQDIKRSLNYAAEVILDDTLAVVKPEDLKLVMSSACAKEIAECQEIVDYIKGSSEALAQIRGELPGKNVMYGLPDKLYGYDVEIEVTRKVTSKKGATRAVSPVLASTTPFMCSRPGGLVGVEGAPSFSTCVLFVWDKYDMAVETKRDDDNKRTVGRIVDMHIAKIVASASGFLFTSAV